MNNQNWTTKDSIKNIRQLDYLFHVSKSMDDDPETTVFFGEMGMGQSPNYLIVKSDGSEVAYRGRSHVIYQGAESFDKNNISKKGFSVDEIEDVFDQQKKSRSAAIHLMSNFWKLNKDSFKAKPTDKHLYRKKIVALSSAGTPIAKAFELVLG